MVPDRILVATDGSASAQAAELFAASLAGRLGGTKVTVVTVVRPREVPAARGGFNLAPLHEEELVAAQELLAESEKRVRAAVSGADVVVESRLIEDRSPAAGIVDAAHEDGTCSLIVVGSRGHGGLASLILGSVSTQVLHVAHCPVLVIRD